MSAVSISLLPLRSLLCLHDVRGADGVFNVLREREREVIKQLRG